MSFHYEARFCAIGGQGIITAGGFLAAAAIMQGRNAVQSPTYTSQVRGGPTKVDVVISDEEILFQRGTKLDLFFAMAQKPYDLYYKDLKDDTLVIVEENLVNNIKDDGKKVIRIPFIELAEKEIGLSVTTSVIVTGAVVALTGIVEKKAMEEAILSRIPKGTEMINLKAFELGYKVGSELK